METNLIKRPINYIFLEGPDLAGKTTLYEALHKDSDYRWNIQDRSALSMLIHAKLYNRNEFNHIEQLRSELYNLNNVTIILLPPWTEIVERFNVRGDAIQNMTSLQKLYRLYTDAAEELQDLPNVFVIKNIVDADAVKFMTSNLESYEDPSTNEIQKSCLIACNNKDREVVGLNFTLYDDGDFSCIDDGDLLYEKEVDYYDKILSSIKDKIRNEIKGNNEHARPETRNSRRFIYSSDTCISLAHFLLRGDSLDCKFFLRSSDVKNTLYYDLNFLNHVAYTVYTELQAQGLFCRMKFIINSGHIIEEDTL